MARVLIVEPEPDLQQLAREALIELGHEAVLPGSPAATLRVDVVLLAPCPGMRTLIRSLRREQATLPVVCIGGWPVSDEIRLLDPVAYLVKPYSLDALDRALGQAVAVSGAM